MLFYLCFEMDVSIDVRLRRQKCFIGVVMKHCVWYLFVQHSLCISWHSVSYNCTAIQTTGGCACDNGLVFVCHIIFDAIQYLTDECVKLPCECSIMLCFLFLFDFIYVCLL